MVWLRPTAILFSPVNCVVFGPCGFGQVQLKHNGGPVEPNHTKYKIVQKKS